MSLRAYFQSDNSWGKSIVVAICQCYTKHCALLQDTVQRFILSIKEYYSQFLMRIFKIVEENANILFKDGGEGVLHI